MANTPNPEFISEIMERDFGTTVLITNAKSDRYLKKPNTTHEVKENLHTPEVEAWCGGSNGWDNFVERWHK